jgi:hypothetical protein
VDARLPEHLQDVERDTFAKNRGFDSYSDYRMSQWDNRPKEHPAMGPFRTVDPGNIDTPMTLPKGKK